MEKFSIQHAVADVCVEQLNRVQADGETVQYILKGIGMEEQMLSQLIGTFDKETIDYYLSLHNKK